MKSSHTKYPPAVVMACLLLVVFTLITCEKPPRDNPWDALADISPGSWAPSFLSIRVVSNNSLVISWEYGNHNIEGFHIDRKEGENEWQNPFVSLPPDSRSYTDNSVNLESSEYSYRLYAYAGPNASSQVIVGTEDIWPRDTQTQVVDVLNPATGKTWMDRNLGASRAATSSTDAEAYGDLYQWGRAADGHQKRNSGMSSSLSGIDAPGHGNFITVNSSPWDWRNPQNRNLWQRASGINNPCPQGYRLPTDAELNAERQSWSSGNSAGAFASPLKLPVAGFRVSSNGSLYNVGSLGYYWSGTVDGIYSRRLYFHSGYAGMLSGRRASGYSVRCIKN